MPGGEILPPTLSDDGEEGRPDPIDTESLLTPQTNVSWKQGRQLLRQ